MRARFECKRGTLRGQRFELEAEATVGRGLDNTIVLDDGQISTHHARIWFDEGRGSYLLEDLESLNGTEVDGVKVIHPEPLPGLHVVTFAGELDFIFQRLPEPADEGGEAEPGDEEAAEAADGEGAAALEAPAPAGRAEAEPPSPPATPEPPGGPLLEVTLPSGEPLRLLLRQGEQLLGRGGDADLRVDADQVSRRHARLTVAGERVLLADLGSSNHTFVDDRQIEGEVELAPGARIRFGNLEARLLAAETATPD